MRKSFLFFKEAPLVIVQACAERIPFIYPAMFLSDMQPGWKLSRLGAGLSWASGSEEGQRACRRVAAVAWLPSSRCLLQKVAGSRNHADLGQGGTDRRSWGWKVWTTRDFPDGARGKEPACQEMLEIGLRPGSATFPGEGNGNPLQDSCLENPADRGGWRATVHGAAKTWIWLKRLSTHMRAEGVRVL